MTINSSISPNGEPPRSPASHLGHEEVAIFETFVVPGYLSLFGDRLLSMLARGRDARVCHLHCRTGYPDRAILERLPNAHVHGCDRSEHAIELARAKAAALKREESNVVFDYRVAEKLPLSFPHGSFSHAFSLHPLVTPADRHLLLRELARIVAPRGQGLLAMPLRGSFAEIEDLLRECALKHELAELTDAVDEASQARPTDETLARELEACGFEYVDVDMRSRTLKFAGGRDFFEDPAARLMLVPELRLSLGLEKTPSLRGIDPLAYVRDAIDKYWSDSPFEVTVKVGVVSGRRKA